MAHKGHPARLDSRVSFDAQPTISPTSSMPFSSFDPQSFTRGMSESIFDPNQKEMQEMIKEYIDRMPSDVKIGYYDVMILYAEDDRELATKYRDHLQNDITLEGGRRVTAVLYDDQELVSLAGSKLRSLAYGFQRCTFAFIYLTKSFCQCEWSAMSSEECLMESIYNPEKKWCVVPVYTVSRAKADFKIPMGLNALKGVNYYNDDDFYRRGLRRLIGDKVMVRLHKNREHFKKQYNYACKIRNEDWVKRKTEEDLRKYQQLKQEELRKQLEKENRQPKLLPSGYDEQPTDSMVVQKQHWRYQEIQSQRPKNLPVESEEDFVPRHTKEQDSPLKQKPRSKQAPTTGLEDPSLEQGSVIDFDYTSIGESNTKFIQKEVVNGSQVYHHVYHHFPEGPGQVTKNYNIYKAENVAIGENATIVSNTENENLIGEEESRRDSIRSSVPPSLDGAPSRLSSENEEESVTLPPGINPALPIKPTQTPPPDTKPSRTDSKPDNSNQTPASPQTLEKRSPSFPQPVKLKPWSNSDQKPKPSVAMVSPMQSLTKQTSAPGDDETSPKLHYRDNDDDDESTDLKQPSTGRLGSGNTTNIQKVTPKRTVEDDTSEETVVKQVPVFHTKPIVLPSKTQGACVPQPSHPVCRGSGECVKRDDDDVTEDGPPQDDACRDSGGFVEVNQEDVASYVDTENVGTDVDSGILTKSDRGLECVKQALKMGYQERPIKQALLRLRSKGKVDINRLLDELHSAPCCDTPTSALGEDVSSQENLSKNSKANDSNSKQKPGFLQRIFNKF